MAQDALERLLNTDNDSTPNYSVEEQIASASDDDFLESMSKDSRDALMKTVQPQSSIKEVFIDEDIDEQTSNVIEVSGSQTDVSEYVEPETSNEDENTSNEELSNINSSDKKKQRGRPKQQINEITNQSSTFDPIMNRLALDLLNDLQNKKFRVNGFDDNLMRIVFDYMRTKF